MQIIYKLTKQDIVEALASHFDTTIDKVDLILYTTTCGIGPMEQEVPEVRAEIEVHEN